MTDRSAGLLKKMAIRLSIVSVDGYTFFRLNNELEVQGETINKPIMSITTQRLDEISMFDNGEQALIDEALVINSYPLGTI